MVAVHRCVLRRLRQEDYDFTASLDDLEDEDKKEKKQWKKEEEEEEGEKGGEERKEEAKAALENLGFLPALRRCDSYNKTSKPHTCSFISNFRASLCSSSRSPCLLCSHATC